jgi:acyl carrier protein
MSYQSVREATVENFRDIMHPKALAGWLIHKWAARKQLDCLVFFSSSAALMYYPFVGSYAAACAFLDGLAHRRAGQGLAGLSINWGLWATDGMAADLSQREFQILETRGMRSFPPDLGFEVLGLLTQQKNPQVAVIPVDWEKWKRGSAGLARAPMFDRVIGTAPSDNVVGEIDMRAAISAASGAERYRMVREAVRKNVATVLGLPEGDLDEGMSLSRLGLDSLMATELRNRLAAGIGCSLTLVHLLKGPSVCQLVDLLEAELNVAARRTAEEVPAEKPGSTTTSGTIPPREAGRVLEKLDDLSDEQVDTLLNEILRDQETTS